MTDAAEMRWYVVHTYSGYENKVKANIEKTVENQNMQHLIEKVVIPIEEVLEVKNGRSHVAQHKRMPGYVLVHMIMTNEAWYVVRNTRGVTGFVGTGNKPSPLSDADYEALMASIPVTRLDIQIGDDVRILSGIFENFTGRVSQVDPVTKRVTVVVEMLNRATNVELALDEVVRVEI